MLNNKQIETIVSIFECNFYTSVMPTEAYISLAVKDLFPAKIQALSSVMPDNPVAIALQARLAHCLMGDTETLSSQTQSISECFNELSREIYCSQHYDLNKLKSVKLGSRLDEQIALNYGPSVAEFYGILPEMRVEFNKSKNFQSFIKLQKEKLKIYRSLKDLTTRHHILKTSKYWELLRCELPIIKSRIDEALIRYQAGTRRAA